MISHRTKIDIKLLENEIIKRNVKKELKLGYN